MKIHVSIECTPTEARAALGLPDFVPMQNAVIEQAAKHINFGPLFDPAAAMTFWSRLMPAWPALPDFTRKG